MSTRTNFDSSFCGSLPLHNINLIQDYGYLVVINNDLVIVQLSENCEDLFGKPVGEVLNTTLTAYTTGELLKTALSNGRPFNFELAGIHVFALFHKYDDYILIELEKTGSDMNTFIEISHDLKNSLWKLEQAQTVHAACELALHELKAMSDFDKIMIYRFDEDWNGLVTNEVSEEGMESYLGLKFPASDIPKQARDLYLKNPYRLIPNRDYTSVRLNPVINPVSESFTNLSDCNVRGVAAVHLEYLKNMNVMASMSTRILLEGQLWGLISCHHREARYLGFEKCSIFEMWSIALSSRMAAINHKENFEALHRMRDLQARLTERIFIKGDYAEGILAGDNTFLLMLGLTGVAVSRNGKIVAVGRTPAKADIESLCYWLHAKNIDTIYTHTRISEVYDSAIEFADVASGILVIPVNTETSSFIIGFRPGEESTVSWGGNPHEAIKFEDDRKSYHPRNSFALWKETVKNTAKAWDENELNTAKSLRNFIIDFDSR